MRAAGSLRTIFSDDLSDVDPVLASDGVTVPAGWEYLLEEAVEASVLNTAAAKKWSRAFFKHAQEEHEQLMDILKSMRRSEKARLAKGWAE